MVLLNISLVLVFMTALLQKIVSAPHTPDQPSTSSEPIALDDPPKGPPIYYNFLEEHPKKDVSSTPLKTSTPNKLIIPLEVAYSLEERVKCKRDINAVFKDSSSPEDHIKHAITYLTLDDPSLVGYARLYYVSLAAFLRKGKIPSVSRYCFPTPNTDDCQSSIISVFKNELPKKCLMFAFHYLNEKSVKESRNIFALDYFLKVRENFEIDLEPLDTAHLGQRYLKPFEYCDSKIRISPEELKLTLTL